MNNTLHILSLNRQAGVEVMFIRFLEELKEKRPEIFDKQIVYALSISDYFIQKLESLEVKYYVRTKSAKFSLGNLIELIDVVNTNQVINIYGQNFNGNIWASLVGKICGKNIICHEHGTAWKAKGVTSFLTYFWTSAANLIICNSEASKVILKERFKAKNSKLRIIYNGVPKSQLCPVDKEKNLLLFVGRLENVKSPDTLVYAIHILKEKIPNIKLKIIGDGSLKSRLIELVNQLKLEKYITFTGYVEDPKFYMAEASLLLLPSIRESLGNVIIEAAYQNTPSIATNVDGIAEAIINGETGILLNPKMKTYYPNMEKFVVDPIKHKLVSPKKVDPRELSEAIYRILTNNEYKRMGIQANKYVSTRFSMEEYCSSVVKCLN